MNRASTCALGAAVAGGVLVLVEWMVAPERLAGAYLSGVSFATTLSLGAFIVACVMNLSGASWAIPFRRLYGAMSGSLPLLAASVVPLVLAPAVFYPWARNEVGTGLGLIRDPRYFGPAPFAVRVFVEVAVLVAFEEIVRWRSLVADVRRIPTPHRRVRGLSGAALLVIAFVGSLAVQDLFMSVNDGWNSDVYGLYSLVGGFSAALGALAIAARATLPELHVTPSHASALGRTTLVGIALWAYLAFALFLLTWIADLPREVTFYTGRSYGEWGPLFFILWIGHFALPLLLLLPWLPKRNLGYVAAIGGLLVVAHALDSYWLLMPAFAERPSGLDLGPILLLGGLAAFVSIVRYRRHSALPDQDPALASALAYESK